jgi:hypothetical protein
MDLKKVIELLGLNLITDEKYFESIIPTGGYASDLLSCVMAGAKHGNIWVTIQSHMNIVAVAALLDLSGIIITEDARPDQLTIDKANEQGVTILLTQMPTYMVSGKLWESGIRSN